MVGVQIPHHFRCPISLELMRDPVTVSTGQTYDRSSIEPWIAARNTTCPVTRAPLLDSALIPNHTLRRLIQSWCVANRRSGVKRIPTPKQPADPSRVRALLSQAASTSSATAAPRLSSSFRNRLAPSAAAGLVIFLKQDDSQGSGGHCGQPWTILARPQTRSFG
ncbi:U-box domain-containing protein 25-like [Eucalyptus grandis]|uniref:U-box domain-containing protein 25-like n=1 Tax=Eucalyptus grandis TaxID=71139 RepID=UPI00192EB59B|nr:U-box domain-containing protein 25-like [Eucalyptus grandis]